MKKLAFISFLLLSLSGWGQGEDGLLERNARKEAARGLREIAVKQIIDSLPLNEKDAILYTQLTYDYKDSRFYFNQMPFTGVAYDVIPHEYVQTDFKDGVPHGYRTTFNNIPIVGVFPEKSNIYQKKQITMIEYLENGKRADDEPECGFSFYRFKYDSLGRKIEHINYDINGQLIGGGDCGAPMERMEYDKKGRLIAVKYFGTNAEPINQYQGDSYPDCHETRWIYNVEGKLLETRWISKDGKLLMSERHTVPGQYYLRVLRSGVGHDVDGAETELGGRFTTTYGFTIMVQPEIKLDSIGVMSNIYRIEMDSIPQYSHNDTISFSIKIVDFERDTVNQYLSFSLYHNGLYFHQRGVELIHYVRSNNNRKTGNAAAIIYYSLNGIPHQYEVQKFDRNKGYVHD